MNLTKDIEKKFEMPTAQIVVFDAEDVIVTSGNNQGGGFLGEWDTNIPEIEF